MASNNKTLVLCSRGVTFQHRHLVSELSKLLSNTKKETKIDRKKHPGIINELCEKHSCTYVFYIESKGKISYLFIGKYPDGPTIKFLIQSIRTSEELKLNGNSSIHARQILSFDNSFTQSALLKLVKEMLSTLFSEPLSSNRTSVDRVLSFTSFDMRIFFRNFEVISAEKTVEIGPRFVLTVLKVYEGFMGSEIMFRNGKFNKSKKAKSI